MKAMRPLRRSLSLRSFGIGTLAVAALLSAPPAAHATSGILNSWKSAYPTSLSDDNAALSGSACVLCHAAGNNSKWNGYGWKLREFINAGNSTSQAIQMAQALNSDADPGSASNLAETTANSQPGWTPGAVNTVYSSGGPALNQLPPAGIGGNLDPGLCGNTAAFASYGTGKMGTHGVPTLTSASPPKLGGVSDLTIANGLPNATALLFSGVAQTSVPFDGGTLLVSPLWTIAVPLNAAGGIALPVPLPANAALCGQSAKFQVMFQDPGAGGFLHTAQTAGLSWTLGS